jgi:hypothetical protein
LIFGEGAMATEGPLVVPCAADPKVETALRCGRCDTPICPRCLVMTPVGARCRSCAQLRKNPIFVVGPVYYLRAIGAGLAVAAVGTYVLAFIPFFQFFGLLLLGAAVGESVTWAANRKRGTGLAVVAVVTMIVGALIASLFTYGPTQVLSPWGLFVALAAVIAAGRVR